MQNLPSTELINPNTVGMDRLSTLEMLTRINDEDAKVSLAVQSVLPQIAQAVDAIAAGFRKGGRLIYVGAGTSGRLGILDASECLPTFGVAPEMVFGIIAGGEYAITHSVEGAEDDSEAGASVMDTHKVGVNDVVVGIAASGATPYARAAVKRAKMRGAVTVGVACATPAPLCEEADIPIQAVVGPEVLQGSTRLKSGTAQKLILNMLSTGAMIKIGKTYGNRMVDVQATNKKLVERSLRLIQDIGQVSELETAQALLTAANGSVKLAILMGRTGLTATEARDELQNSGDFLSVALKEI